MDNSYIFYISYMENGDLKMEENKNMTAKEEFEIIEENFYKFLDLSNEQSEIMAKISSSWWQLILDDLFFHRFKKATDLAYHYSDLANLEYQKLHTLLLKYPKEVLLNEQTTNESN